MRSCFILFLLLFPVLSFSQDKDYISYDKAVRLLKEGKTKKAVKFAKKSLISHPNWSTPNLFLANIFADDNQIDLAVRHLLVVYDLEDQDDVKGIEQIGQLYYRKGYYKNALYYFEK